MSFRLRSVALALVFVTASACHSDSTGPGYAFAAGTYVLTSVNGRGPDSGSLTLSAAGQAERRVRYAQGSGTSPEYVARGSYQVGTDGIIDLRLREDDGRSEYEWRPMARLTGRAVELRHPDPADGPDIVERYERL